VLGRPPFTELLLALAFSCHLFWRFPDSFQESNGG
jgi:hypothetical protein